MSAADSFIGRIARAARSRQPLWRVTVSPQLARLLIAAGARRAPAVDEMTVSHEHQGAAQPVAAPDERPTTPRSGVPSGERHSALVAVDALLQRGHQDQAISILRAQAERDDEYAAWKLADVLAELGRVDEAIDILRARAGGSDEYAGWKLAGLLAEIGRVDEAIAILQAWADEGHEYAAWKLTDVRATRSHHPEAPQPHLGTPDAGTAARRRAAKRQLQDRGSQPHAEAPASLTTARATEVFQSPPRPAVLYQADQTTVTTAYFESGSHRFPIAELDQVERVEQGGFLESRRYELWALFRGQRVRLYYSYDHTEFGRVVRALTRAYEYAGLPDL